MEGHFITGYADGQNKPETPIELKSEVFKEALALTERTKYNNKQRALNGDLCIPSSSNRQARC